tara:strand:+ start:462 stop:1442 length:981 start_codon:yes stop_codon:yes gene_type:complete
MATTNSITTTYAGEFAGEYIAAALTSGKTLNDGAIAIKPNVKFKEVLKNVSLTDAIKDATCDFDPTSTVTLDERVLQPKELQVNMQLCKSDFRSDWEAISMGYSAHDNLPPNFADFIIGHVSAKVAESVEQNIWQGDDDGSGSHTLFDGFEQLISSSTLSGVGSSTVDSGNVITFLGKIVDNIPTAVYGQEDLTIYTPNNVYQAYVRALGGFAVKAYGSAGSESAAASVGANGVDNKGTTFYGMNEGLTFDGIKLQRCPGMSSNRAVAAQASNLYFGTGLLADHNEVKLIDMADIDGSQNVRLVMRFTAGTQVGILSDAKHFTATT